MPPILISIAGIKELLIQLDTNKSCGPNGIPVWVLKHCAPETAPILSGLLSQSLHTGLAVTKFGKTFIVHISDFAHSKIYKM